MAQKPDEQAVCARCGKDLDSNNMYLAHDSSSARSAGLCRVEHIVAWVMRGAEWQVEKPWELAPDERTAEGEIELLRRRDGTETTTAFESPDALRQWASAGGPWARD